MQEKAFTSTFHREDPQFEDTLRPQKLQHFIGQDHVIQRLALSVAAALQRGDALGHVLFSGPPGLGKTTLAYLLSKEMNTSIVVTSGPMLDKPSDLAGIVTNLSVGDVLFIDEIHRMHRGVEEYLYSAMEDFVLDVMIDKGANARSIQVTLNRFTLVGATTRSGLLTAPMRSRFLLHCRLQYYDTAALGRIIARAARIIKVNIDDGGISEIAARGRGTPRIANNLLRWIRDYAQIHKITYMDRETTKAALSMLSIDEKGLEDIDKAILNAIIEQGGPVGLETLAIAVGEDKHTIGEVYEPFLITEGLLQRTPRGRIVTQKALLHLGKTRNLEKS